MNDQMSAVVAPWSAAQPFSVLLSRDELLATLDSLKAEFIPGLDPDPLGDLTPEGRDLAITVARRALQARELARVENGQFMLTRGLLAAVGACAYSERAVLAYHWPQGSAEAQAFFGHRRGADVILHSRPADVLHRLVALPSRAALVDRLLDFCEFTRGTGEPAEFKVDAQGFVRARALAEQDRAAEAADALCEAGAAPAAATAVAEALTSRPAVSVVRVMKQQEDRSITTWEFSLLQGASQGWWLAPDGAAEGGTLTLGSATKEHLAARLAEWL